MAISPEEVATGNRDASVEQQVLVCECARSEVTKTVDSLRCASEGAEHSGMNFPGFPVLTKALLNKTSLPALSTVELCVGSSGGGVGELFELCDGRAGSATSRGAMR